MCSLKRQANLLSAGNILWYGEFIWLCSNSEELEEHLKAMFPMYYIYCDNYVYACSNPQIKMLLGAEESTPGRSLQISNQSLKGL